MTQPHRVMGGVIRAKARTNLPPHHRRKLEHMPTPFPKAVPEIPVTNVEKAAEYYVNALGFHLDWHSEQDGIGGISQGECRMFLTNPPFRQHYGNNAPVIVWLNLNSKEE